VRELLWPLFAWSARAQPATVEAGTTGEGAAQATVTSVGVGSANHWVGGTKGECAALASVRLVGVAQQDTLVAGTTGEGAALAYVRLVGVGPATHCGGGHESSGRCSGL
jgi:hypothetical protein